MNEQRFRPIPIVPFGSFPIGSLLAGMLTFGALHAQAAIALPGPVIVMNDGGIDQKQHYRGRQSHERDEHQRVAADDVGAACALGIVFPFLFLRGHSVVR